jgi:hypothetical protein
MLQAYKLRADRGKRVVTTKSQEAPGLQTITSSLLLFIFFFFLSSFFSFSYLIMQFSFFRYYGTSYTHMS